MVRINDRKIRQYVELIPVLLFAFHAVVYASFACSEALGTTFIMEDFYWIMKHVFDMSLFGVLIMFYISYRDKWHAAPRICTWAILALWINNIPYSMLGLEIGVYFFIFATIIYVSCILLTLIVLTR